MSLDTGPIQTPAPGFLSLLNLKNKGLLPDLLRGNLQPVVDLAEYFQRGSLQNITTNYTRVQAAATVTGFLAFNTPSAIVVPQDETWYVESATVRALATGAGSVLDEYGFGFQLAGGVNPYFIRGNLNSVSAAKTSSVSAAHEFWLPPGAILGVWCGTVTVNPIQFDLFLRYAACTA